MTRTTNSTADITNPVDGLAPAWLTREQWPFTIRFADVAGHRIHYVDEGQGPLLLFVHAGFWSFLWRDVIRQLRDRFRCVALDFPGHGLSEEAEGYQVGLASHRDVLNDFVDVVGLHDATLVLHDLGGPIGLLVAAERPGLVRGLVPMNTFGWKWDERALKVMIGIVGSRPMTLFGTATNLVAKASAMSLGVGRQLSAEGRKAFLGPFRNPSRRSAFHRLMRDARHSGHLMAEVETALRTVLSDQPMLTVFGERNDPFGFQRRFKSMFPNAREYVVSKGNHFPMCDDPTGVADAISTWMDSLV